MFLLGILYVSKEEKKIPKENIFSFILAIIGVLIIMEVWNGLLLIESIFFGLSSAILLAVSIYIRKLIYKKRKSSNLVNNERESAFNTFLAWWGTLTLIIFYLPMGAGDVLRLTVIEFLVCLLLGLIPTALAFILYNIGVKYDRNGNVIIFGYFEPFVATINTAIFLQQISIFTILGGILIIIANIIILRNSKKTNQNNTIEME